jgi:hypothetical protein
MISISLTYGITLYDSAYVALGKVLNDKVYTADEKLLRRVKDLPFVFHIKDYDKRKCLSCTSMMSALVNLISNSFFEVFV